MTQGRINGAIIGLWGGILAAGSAAAETGDAAGWTLSAADSRIAFVSVKAGEIVETHTFPALSGGVDAAGAARIEIDLNAVDTKIDIRNQRMREMFFETDEFPTAALVADIDLAAYEDLGVGDRKAASAPAILSLHGVEAPVEASVFVTRIAQDRVAVEAAEPVVLELYDFKLTEGLERLRDVAGLPAITPASPVTFTFVFER